VQSKTSKLSTGLTAQSAKTGTLRPDFLNPNGFQGGTKVGDDRMSSDLDPAQLFAEISKAYIEILAGVRRPEQLARWLSDKAYYDISQRAKREAMQRQITGAKARPDISLRKSKTFLTDDAGIHGVVILRVSGATKAVALRAERIHDRFRVTEVLII
jgi:hypothetical protein